MRKTIGILLCLLLLSPRAFGAERKYVALILEDPVPEARMLAELARRDARITFFLSSQTLRASPELVRDLGKAGHEIGLGPGQSLAPLSRRAIAGELNARLALVPPGNRVRFLLPPDAVPSAGTRQVARALGLCLAQGQPCGTGPDNAARSTSLLGRVRDGDILLARQGELINLVALLQNQGFHLVTLSELAALRQTQLHPGQTYTHFPPPSPP